MHVLTRLVRMSDLGSSDSARRNPRTRRGFARACAAAALALVATGACRDAAGTAGPATAARTTQSAAIGQSPDVVAAVSARLAGAGGPSPFRSRREQEEIARLYRPGANGALWIDPDGRPAARAHEALAILTGADKEGLDPADYEAAAIARLAATLDAKGGTPSDLAAFDLTLSIGTLRYLRHLHQGRVEPRRIGFRLEVPDDAHDFVATLQLAIASGKVAATLATFEPPLQQYRALLPWLARYRGLAADRTLDGFPAPGKTVRPGEPYPALEALHRRLVALGDLPADAPAPEADAVYDLGLVEGVMRFQARHGLEPDGVLGRVTQTALAVPLAWRARQIELALERLRWLPDLDTERAIALNIPMFRLWAWDAVGGRPTLTMRAIVGRAPSTQTPVLTGPLDAVIFRPYWNVPRSILVNEILPLEAQKPGYLARQQLEIVAGQMDASPVVEATAENLARLREGSLRLRQRPGPRNSLGLVKFVFRNDADVYLHDTPAQELFGRTRRDFSHGCVRVEDPVALAEWVLDGQAEWTRDRIVAATQGLRPTRAAPASPITVILYYVTAVVMPDDGSLHFAEDIYRHDTRLDRALMLAGAAHPQRAARLPP